METSTMIRQLRRTAKKHENDKLHTFDTDISLMCTDVANRLEKLEKEKQEIRARAIDEFEKEIVAEYDNDGCPGVTDYLDYTISIRDLFKIAEQLKGGEKDARNLETD